MEATRFNVQYTYGQTIKIKPLIDPHIGAYASDIPKLKSYLKDSEEDTYFINCGDLFDSIIFTDVRYSKGHDATSALNSAIIDEQVDMGCELLAPYANRFLGIGEGNHERKVANKSGTNPAKRICRRLNIPYLGYSGLLRLYLHEEGNTRGRSVIIRYHHGFGGGRTGGSSITRYEKELGYWDADIYMYGHDHDINVKPYARIALAGRKVINKPKWLITGGTFLKTFTVGGEPTYSEIKGYRPLPIGGVLIEIKPSMNWCKIKASAEV